MKTLPPILLIALLTVACDKMASRQTEPVTVKMGVAANMVSGCLGHHEHLCGPESDDIRTQFKTAFASEDLCRGVRLVEVTKQEEQVPFDKLSGSLRIFYESPSHWSYRLNHDGSSLGATVGDEREIAKQVCRIMKSMGGATE